MPNFSLWLLIVPALLFFWASVVDNWLARF